MADCRSLSQRLQLILLTTCFQFCELGIIVCG